MVRLSCKSSHPLGKDGMRLQPSERTQDAVSLHPALPSIPSPATPLCRPDSTHLLCLEAMLQLQSQLIRLVLHQARGPEARPGLHAERGVARPLAHAVEVRVLHGRVATLGHLCLRRVLLGEHGGLLLQHHVGVLTGELFRVHCLALKRKPPENTPTNKHNRSEQRGEQKAGFALLEGGSCPYRPPYTKVLAA